MQSVLKLFDLQFVILPVIVPFSKLLFPLNPLSLSTLYINITKNALKPIICQEGKKGNDTTLGLVWVYMFIHMCRFIHAHIHCCFSTNC